MLYTLYFQGAKDDGSNLRGVDLMDIKAAGEPSGLASMIRNEIYSVDKNLKIDDISAVSALVNDNLSQERAIATLAGFFSLLSLSLASIGLYGLMSYSVNQRTPEVGVRMALGARTGDIQRMILGDTLLMLTAGILVGLLGAFAATRAITSLLYGVTPMDWVSVVAATVVIAGACIAAGLLPARRAALVDPMTALRCE